MALFSRKTTAKRGGIFSRSTGKPRTTYDISDIEGLKEVAASKGLEVKEKPTVFLLRSFMLASGLKTGRAQRCRPSFKRRHTFMPRRRI